MARRCGRLVAPEQVDEPVRRDDRVRVEQQHREEGALLRPSQLHSLFAVEYLERPENPELHAASA